MLSLLYNNIALLIIFIITLKINSKYFKLDPLLFNSFLFYHGLFTLLYLFVFNGKTADYYTYLYLVGMPYPHDYIDPYSFLSSNFVYQIINLFKSLLLNDFNIIVIFSLISFFGIIIFIQNLIKLGMEKKFAYIMFFIPGVHFWTSILGKDSLIFFFLSCFFYFYINKKFFYSIIFIILVFLIRPHIGLMFLISITITEFFLIKGLKKYIFVFSSLSFLILIFNLPFINNLFLNSSQLLTDNLIIKIFHELSNISQKFLLSSSYYEPSSIYVNMFNYIVFPLPFILSNNSFVTNSFILMEFLTLIFVITLIIKNKKSFEIDKRVIYFLSICVLVYLMIMPQIFFNFGLNSRQKWMIIPFIIYFFVLLKNLFVKTKKM